MTPTKKLSKRATEGLAVEVVVVTEERYDRTPDGRVWARSSTSYLFWSRYLEVFRPVRVVARIRDVPAAAPGWREVTGPDVTCTEVPYYKGPRQYLQRWLSVQAALRRAVPPGAAVILRGYSILGSAIAWRLSRSRRPYAIEVVSDPWDVFAPGAVSHPLRAVFRWRFSRRLERECAGAIGVSYVTERSLQQRYPGGPSAYTIGCSDVELPDEAFARSPRTKVTEGPIVLIGVGTLEQRYKGFDLLIQALALGRQEGLDLRLVILGDGRHMGELKAMARAVGVAEETSFLGWLASREEVRRELDRADVFVLSSRAEGLPRALVEAMARGLPCIGTRVGGVPELLSEDCIVRPEDALALADSIVALARSSDRRVRESQRNMSKARSEYHKDVLQRRRCDFYRVVRDRTTAWLRSRRSQG